MQIGLVLLVLVLRHLFVIFLPPVDDPFMFFSLPHPQFMWNHLTLTFRSKMAAGIRPTLSSRPRTQTYSPLWMCTTYQPQNPVHAITLRLDPCASYRTLCRGWEYSSKEWLHGGVWTGGRLMLLWFPDRQTLALNFPSTKYAWTAETGGGTRVRRPIENAETSSTNQPMENNKLLFSETCLCDTRPEGRFWKEVIWTSNSVISQTMLYHIFFTVWYLKVFFFFLFQEVCTDTWSSYICKCNNSNFNV